MLPTFSSLSDVTNRARIASLAVDVVFAVWADRTQDAAVHYLVPDTQPMPAHLTKVATFKCGIRTTVVRKAADGHGPGCICFLCTEMP